MGLLPLEFTDCLQDSPYFRDSLHSHEKELERTSANIKEIIKLVKNLHSAEKNLSRAHRSLSSHLLNFKFDCIGNNPTDDDERLIASSMNSYFCPGNNQTDDERVIAGSLKEFGKLISSIEDERDRVLEHAFDNFIVPLETFRKEQIGAVKARKKRFDQQTKKFCASQERYLGLSTKKQDTLLQEADAILEMEQRDFAREALEYVCLIQEVQERKKFEFVEPLQALLYGLLTFYHQGHEVHKDFKPFFNDLQIRVQKTRTNFLSSRNDIQALMRKMLEVRQTKPMDPLTKVYTRTGYLFCMEKKALGTTWIKCYCQYIRENRLFCMIPYNQTTSKITSTEKFKIKSCLRKTTESIDKRFCFDIISDDRPSVIYTFQAQSEDDRNLWLEALDGKEPRLTNLPGKPSSAEESYLDESGFHFMRECFNMLEKRGLEEEGLYRVVGVASKVTKLLNSGLDRRKLEKLNLENIESKTITSAVKTFLRNLPEPLMSFELHHKFIEAAKYETYSSRLNEVHRLVHKLPVANCEMLELLLNHLSDIAEKSDKNLMTVSNLGVCFGPTLLRAEEETVAAIMDIKFANVVIEILIHNWKTILKTKPGSTAPPKPAHSSTAHLLMSPSGPTQQQAPTTPSSTSVLSHASPPSGGGGGGGSGPPPYIPPPPPSQCEVVTDGDMKFLKKLQSVEAPPEHPTLTTAVIFEGPKLHTQNTNGPPYATWERTLKTNPQTGGIGAASTSGNPPHRSIGGTVSSVSTSSLLNPQAPSGVSSQLNNSNNQSLSPQQQQIQPQHIGGQQPSQPQPWYRPNISSTRPQPHHPQQLQKQQIPTHLATATIPGSGSSGHLTASSALHHGPPGGQQPLTRQLSGASASSSGVLGQGLTGQGGGGGGLGHLSGYETSTTHRSSSSSTDSLVSNSSREGGDSQPSHPGVARGGVGERTSRIPGKVRTLYACVGEHETELSFEPNQILTNVYQSLEPGWLEGNLDGKVGLVPENYVEFIP